MSPPSTKPRKIQNQTKSATPKVSSTSTDFTGRLRKTPTESERTPQNAQRPIASRHLWVGRKDLPSRNRSPIVFEFLFWGVVFVGRNMDTTVLFRKCLSSKVKVLFEIFSVRGDRHKLLCHSFYWLVIPKPKYFYFLLEAIRSWIASVPPGFRFHIKAFGFALPRFCWFCAH